MVKTGFITDRQMLEHRCEWDPAHMEVPERLSTILDKLESSNILSDCIHLQPREATKVELQFVHDIDYINKIETTKDMNLEELEAFSCQYEDVFLNSETWKCSLLSAGSALELTEKVIKKEVDNGFAAIRPPGHHAWKDEACGFCIFNNVAICAKYARSVGVGRVLIVDWDVHAGQGTQYVIDDDPNIKLVSIHRFQNGNFWPHLPESAVNHGYKNTINIPLDRTGYGDSAYISIMHSVVLPLIGEWRPELILVSCGFDAALGDRDGGMNITPLGYEYMTGILSAQGIPLALILEGGYFLRIIDDSAFHTMKALKSQEVPRVRFGLDNRYFGPLLETWNLIFFESINLIRKLKGRQEIDKFETKYEGEHIRKTITSPYPTRDLYQLRSNEEDEAFLEKLRQIYTTYTEPIEEINFITKSVDTLLILKHNGQELELRITNDSDRHFLYYQVILPLSLDYHVLHDGDDISLKPAEFFKTSVPIMTTVISCELAHDLTKLPFKLFE